MTTSSLKDGDWIGAMDGIGNVCHVASYRVERYHAEYLSGRMTLGAPYNELVVHKLFCNFDGKPIKRNRLRWCNAQYCRTLSEEDQQILDTATASHPAEYAKYLDMKMKKPLDRVITVWPMLPEADVAPVEGIINEYNREGDGTFVYDDLIEEIHITFPRIDFSPEHGVATRTHNHLRVLLNNANCATRDGQALFQSVHASIANPS